MKKGIYSKHSEIFCNHIKELRNNAGLTQRDLAAATSWDHALIARIELGERRVDVIEFFHLIKALGVSPEKEAAKLMRAFDRMPD